MIDPAPAVKLQSDHMTIYEELLQTIKYSSASEEAVVSLMHTNSMVMSDFDQFIRQFGITSAQYNILRILRGAHHKGEELGRNDIRRRLIDRVSPDLTRMLARLEKAGLISRDRHRRQGEDQRVVPTRITQRGLDLLDALDGPLVERNSRSMSGLEQKEQLELIRLLEKVRLGVRNLPPHAADQSFEEPESPAAGQVAEDAGEPSLGPQD